MLLYPGFNLADAHVVYDVATSQLCNSTGIAAQGGATSTTSTRAGNQTASTPSSEAPAPSDSATPAHGDLAEALAAFLPTGYDRAVLIEKMEEVNYKGNTYGVETCSTLEAGGPNSRYQVSGSGQTLMAAYGEGITKSLDADDLPTFFRLVVEHYCPEHVGLIPE